MKALGIILIVVGVCIILGVANSFLGAFQMPNLTQITGYLAVDAIFFIIGICLISFGTKLTSKPSSK